MDGEDFVYICLETTYCGILAEEGATAHCFGKWKRNSPSPDHSLKKGIKSMFYIIHSNQETIILFFTVKKHNFN